MALIVCRDCKSKVSSDARSCPKCGRPVTDRERETSRRLQEIKWKVVVPVVGLWALFAMCDDESNDRPAPASLFEAARPPQVKRDPVAPLPLPQPAPTMQDRSAEIAAASLAAGDLDRAPLWYQGSKPWASLSRDVRRQLLGLNAVERARLERANQRSDGTPQDDAKRAAVGKRLVGRIANQYNLDERSRSPDAFGPRMVLWLPAAAWRGLSATQKKSIEAYMSSEYTNWGIGIGRVRNRTVLYDEVVVER